MMFFFFPVPGLKAGVIKKHRQPFKISEGELLKGVVHPLNTPAIIGGGILVRDHEEIVYRLGK